jgi:hypothetical protein
MTGIEVVDIAHANDGLTQDITIFQKTCSSKGYLPSHLQENLTGQQICRYQITWEFMGST